MASPNNILALLIAFTFLMCLSTPSIINSQRPRRSAPRRLPDTDYARMRRELQRIDNELEQNLVEMEKLIGGIEVNAIEKSPATSKTMREAISKIKELLHYIKTTKNFHDADLGMALSNSAKIIADIVSKENPNLRFWITLENYLIKAVQASALLRQQVKLIEVRMQVDRALNKAQYKYNQADFKKIMDNLRGDPEAERRSFQEAMDRYNLDPQRVAEGAIKEASLVSSQAASQVARGVKIIDPNQEFWDLEKISGINPDFIAALMNCNRAENNYLDEVNIYSQTGSQSAALRARQDADSIMTCNKYADGSYIPAFGEPRGTIASTQPRRSNTVNEPVSPNGVFQIWNCVSDQYENGTLVQPFEASSRTTDKRIYYYDTDHLYMFDYNPEYTGKCSRVYMRVGPTIYQAKCSVGDYDNVWKANPENVLGKYQSFTSRFEINGKKLLIEDVITDTAPELDTPYITKIVYTCTLDSVSKQRPAAFPSRLEDSP